MSNTNPHIAGRYAIFIASIGLFGTLSAVLLADYEGVPTDGSAWIDKDKEDWDRILRGNGWHDVYEYNSDSYYTTYRYRYTPRHFPSSIGFRLTKY